MAPYKVLVSIEILRLARPNPRERERIISFLEGLAYDPYKTGDLEEFDAIGRCVQIKIIGAYALTYWADHAVKEIKVVSVVTADGG